MLSSSSPNAEMFEGSPQDVAYFLGMLLPKSERTDFDTWESDRVAVVWKSRHAVAVVNLARLVDRPSLLPIALYECALLGGSVFKGPRRGGELVEHLDQGDIVRCIEGRNKLAAKAVAPIADVFTMLEDSVGCDDASDPDVLKGWGSTIKDWAKDLRLCGSCEKAALDRDTAARKRVWEELPGIFGIEVEG
uniref:Uncharacterized protein n=1 Tax=Ganoderma boninense TaxID=34458 RepID=A0A5K1K4H2_9APHY|nr:Uncharacterized protein [Ganoderma boninense]